MRYINLHLPLPLPLPSLVFGYCRLSIIQSSQTVVCIYRTASHQSSPRSDAWLLTTFFCARWPEQRRLLTATDGAQYIVWQGSGANWIWRKRISDRNELMTVYSHNTLLTLSSSMCESATNNCQICRCPNYYNNGASFPVVNRNYT